MHSEMMIQRGRRRRNAHECTRGAAAILSLAMGLQPRARRAPLAPQPRPAPLRARLLAHLHELAMELMYIAHGMEKSALVSGRSRSETSEKLITSTNGQ